MANSVSKSIIKHYVCKVLSAHAYVARRTRIKRKLMKLRTMTPSAWSENANFNFSLVQLWQRSVNLKQDYKQYIRKIVVKGNSMASRNKHLVCLHKKK